MTNEGSGLVEAKAVVIRLFFNRSNSGFYVQIGEELLFRVTDMIATRIQEKEQISILHVQGVSEMKIISNEK